MSKPYREQLKHQLIGTDTGEGYLDFQTRCVRKFGPPAGIFLKQLVYWIGKEHDPEGWIYKTQSEMETETGLSRKQQEKARKILRAQGVIEEERKGVPRRLYYWVDLEVLLRIMETPHSTMNQRKGNRDIVDDSEQMDNEGNFSVDRTIGPSCTVDSTVLASGVGNTSSPSEDRNTLPASEAPTNDRAITESTSETTAESSSDNYPSENSILQIGASLASHGSTPNTWVGLTDSPKPPVDAFELNRIYYLLIDPDSKAHGAYALHLRGGLSLRDLAGEVCFALTGSPDLVESYVNPVQRMVDVLAMDDGGSDGLAGTR